MSLKLGFERLALYNQWMNVKVYDAAKTLGSEELSIDKGAYFKSIIGSLNHIVVGDIFWFKRFANNPIGSGPLDYFVKIERPESLSTIVSSDLAELRMVREAMDKTIIEFCKVLTPTALTESLEYVNSNGVSAKHNFGWLIQHVFNHQTHHRGQVTTLLTQSGVDVGVTDMLFLIPNE